jgi:rhodanese-related sulfurtransferase
VISPSQRENEYIIILQRRLDTCADAQDELCFYFDVRTPAMTVARDIDANYNRALVTLQTDALISES